MSLTWRGCLTYPQHVPPAAGELLDALASLLPLPETEDRYVALSRWLKEGERLGMLQGLEHARLRSQLAENL